MEKYKLPEHTFSLPGKANDKIKSCNAIIIPEGATNGDMIKAMFGSPIREGESEILHMFTFCNGKSMFPAYFYKGWWNSPYKREK